MTGHDSLFPRLSSIRWMRVAGLVFALLAFLLRQAGWYVSSPVDTPTMADLIKLLGGGVGGRVVEAHRLYAAGYAPRVLLTAEPQARQPGLHYLDRQAVFLVDHGVPRGAIYFDLQAHSTWEEALNTRWSMELHGWRTVLVVSDPPHMRRASWAFGKVFEGSSLQFRLVAAPMSGWDPAHWWRDEASAEFVLMELFKQGFYRAVY